MRPDCGLSDAECYTVINIKRAIFSVTIAMDILTLITIIILRKYQSPSQRIFLNILLSDLGEAISNLANDGKSNAYCTAAGYFVQAFGFTLFMWVCGLTVFLVTLLHVKPEKRPRERTYMIVCWVVPFVVALLPVTTRNYGPAGVFCWITDNSSGNIWRFAVWWIPVIVGILAIFGTFTYMYCKSSSICPSIPSEQTQQNRLVKSYLRPLTGYAATFVVLHILMVVDRVYTLGHDPILLLRIMHMVSFGSYGTILCSLFYIMNGRKDFTLENFKIGLRYHKSVLMGKPIGKITTMKYDTAILTTTEYGMRRPIQFITHNYLEYNLPDVEHQGVSCNEVIQDAPQSDSTKQDSSSYKAGQHPVDQLQNVNEEVKEAEAPLKYLPTRQHSCDAITYDEQMTLSLCELQEINSTIDTPQPKDLGDGPQFNLRQHSQTDICNKEQMHDVITSPTVDSIESLDLSIGTEIFESTSETQILECGKCLPSYTYTAAANSDLVKFYIAEEDATRYENWSDDETVSCWIARIKEDLPEDTTVAVQDADSAYFGKNVTWRQVKSCRNITITINKAITAISFEQ